MSLNTQQVELESKRANSERLSRNEQTLVQRIAEKNAKFRTI